MQTHPDEPWTLPPSPSPPYALGAKVGVRDYYEPAAWRKPYRVIEVTDIRRLDGRHRREYVVEPWNCTGEVMLDRPAKVDEGQLKLWEEI